MEYVLSLNVTANVLLMSMLRADDVSRMWFVSRRARQLAVLEKVRRERVVPVLPEPTKPELVEWNAEDACEDVSSIPSAGSCAEAMSMIPEGRALLMGDSCFATPRLRGLFVDAARWGCKPLVAIILNRFTFNAQLLWVRAIAAAARQGDADIVRWLIIQAREYTPLVNLGAWGRRGDYVMAAAICSEDEQCIQLVGDDLLGGWSQRIKWELTIEYHRNALAQQFLLAVTGNESEWVWVVQCATHGNIELLQFMEHTAQTCGKHLRVTANALCVAPPDALRYLLSIYGGKRVDLSAVLKGIACAGERSEAPTCMRILLERPNSCFNEDSLNRALSKSLTLGDIELAHALVARGARMTKFAYIGACHHQHGLAFVRSFPPPHPVANALINIAIDTTNASLMRFVLSLGRPLDMYNCCYPYGAYWAIRENPDKAFEYIMVLHEFAVGLKGDVSVEAARRGRTQLLRQFVDVGFPVKLRACTNIATYNNPCHEIVELLKERLEAKRTLSAIRREH
jgi:hypothetical protein